MYKRFYIILALLSLALGIQAQDNICRYSMQYQISTDANWGFKYPVITNIEPFGAASRSSLSLGDIIEKIDAIPTRGLSENQINQLLENKDKAHILSIRNTQGRRDVYLQSECHSRNSIGELELANAFSYYSLRDYNDRRLLYPIKIDTKENIEPDAFDNINTFSFAGLNNSYIDTNISREIARLFRAKGMRETDSEQSDMIINFYYTLQDNEKVETSDDIKKYTYRYDFANKEMRKFPILSIGVPFQFAKHKINFGISIFVPKISKEPIWTANIEDLLSETLPIYEYASTNIALMLRHFPFVYSKSFHTYKFSKRHYNYTGIRYSTSNLAHISEVDDDSPAYKSGIRAGDDIISINGIRFNQTDPAIISENYVKFVKETSKYRSYGEDTFVNANGIGGNSFWSETHFNTLAEIFSDNKYNTPFAYLFFFRPYINATNNKDLVFEVEREGKIYSVIVRAEERDYSIIKAE